MNEGAIDTLSIAQRLQKAGFGGEQAEAVTFAIRDGLTGSLADKEDIAHLDGKITALCGEIKEDIAHLDGKITALRGEMIEIRGELKQDIAHLDGKITAEITNLRGEIKEDIAILAGKISVLYWMFSILVAGVASLVIKAFVA